MGLAGKGIKIEHGLHVEQLHRSFQRIPIVRDGDFIEGKVVLEGVVLLIGQDSAA